LNLSVFTGIGLARMMNMMSCFDEFEAKSMYGYQKYSQMKLILTAVEESLADAWTKFCGDLDFVTVHHGSIFDVKCDAVVSPANSYGFMDGGIDGLYMWHFGDNIQMRVRRQIFDHHHGEILVGQADVVETGYETILYESHKTSVLSRSIHQLKY
jgi:hypothetical protein